MANRSDMKQPLIMRPAGLSSDEEGTSDEEGFSFGEPIKYNKPKIEFPRPLEIIETPPMNDADSIRIQAAAGNVEGLQDLFENSQLPVDVISLDSTPLMHAASNCEYNAMEYLLKKGADPNFKRRGYSVLMSACDCIKKCQEEQLKCVKLLFESGSDVNARQNNGITPLMLACKQGREMIVAELINAEANINEQDCLGWTPLMWCINHVTPGQAKTVQILLDAGVDTSITCGRGQSAHAHALNKGLNHIAAQIPVGGIDRIPFLTDVPIKIDSWEILKQNLENKDKKQWNLWQDVARCLHQLGLLHKYGQSFRERDIDLVKFLTLTESELEDMSVIPLHRKRLLDMTRKLHLKRWKASSRDIGSIKNLKDSYNMVDEIKIIANMARQITMIHASVAYIRLHMESHCEGDPDFRPQDLKLAVETALGKAKVLHHALQTYLDYMKNNLGEQKYPPDWIRPEKPHKKSHKTLIVVVITLSMIGMIAWRYR